MVDRRDELRRKYLSLGLGELGAAAVFVISALVSAVPRLEGPERAALWAGLGPLVVILTQAGVYWLLARRWVGRAPMPPGPAAWYGAFRLGNPLLLLGGLATLAWYWPHRPGPAVLAVGLWLFALVEYVNYYLVRLAYPLHRWASGVRQRQSPRLVQDIAGSRPPDPGHL